MTYFANKEEIYVKRDYSHRDRVTYIPKARED